MNCPQCLTQIRKENINIATDLGQCQSCGHLFKVSENMQPTNINDGFDMNKPPKGAWVNKERGEIVVGVSTRSAMAFFLVPFMVVWSGGSIGGIYGTQIITGEFNLILSLFGIPFILASFLFWSLALMAIWGKVELTIDKRGGKIFTGIGKIGRTKTFSWAEVAVVKENQVTTYRKRGSYQSTEILLEGATRLSFGAGLSEDKRYYLLRTMQDIMAKVKGNSSIG
jgi:hypothetical protein